MPPFLRRPPLCLARNCLTDRDPRQILRPQRPALVRHPQALGEEEFQLVAEALAPMAQVRALVRKLVLEELLSSEVLEIRVAILRKFDDELCKHDRQRVLTI